MTEPGHRHVQKYNQFVEVYDPDGIEKLPELQSHDLETLARRREMVATRRERVESLDADEILSASEWDEIANNEQLPDPETVADEQRAEMVERLRLVIEAIEETRDKRAALDVDGFEGFGDPDPIEDDGA